MMHRQSRASLRTYFLLLTFIFMGHGVLSAEIPPELNEARIQEKLGDQLNFDSLNFTDERGQSVAFQSFFKADRPVVLNLVYYGCPTLCGYYLNGFLSTLKELSWVPGDRFEVVTISIDPEETYELAAAKKESILKAYGRPESEKGWHFLTGNEATIRKLASQVGFGYRYDPKDKQYAHSSAAILLTPKGKVSRYLHGISIPSKDLRLALVEASSGKIGTVIDQAILFCFRYDPTARSYSLSLMRLMRAGSAGTAVFVGGYLMVFWRRQRRNSREVEST